MSITELVNQNEGQAEGILNKSNPEACQSVNPEQLTATGQVIQQASHKSVLEDESATTLKDVVVSTLVLLSFAALIAAYFILAS